ncbi:NADH-quinone oxidoreductase subunit NuoH [Microbacter margulisiae]|uniref:NADH-quinone oxidoreductase subunit H n=1 Tax=Microbacter margulisiae TaxID=1350067 RepID=A0A7W5H1F0_9PORP|nr:NADH-quinone oxidoreductase subunit NuoH [Microbacter margulisiae]MBB3186302.1 NADH-quinone oxidoreductase subunit H [Microbacter margulisiae]
MDVIILFKTALIIVILLLSLVIAMYATLVERKIAGFFQDRLGPNRAGIFGILQPVADGVKLFFKEEFMPATADKFLYVLGPSLTMLIALLGSAVIPWGNTLVIGNNVFPLQVADVNIGILYVFAVTSIGVYGIMIGGWSSNNKYALMGAVRSASQMISYELAMGMSIIAIVMMSGTLSLKDIVAQQHGLHWNVWYQPIGFFVFVISAFAECNRTPFDLPECDSELIGGYHTEYSSMKLGFYLFSEYINMFISSAIISSLYFGGYNFPFMHELGLSHNWLTIAGTIAFFIKISFFIFLFMWVRWTLPRFRYDQLMRFGWKVLLPWAIINIVATGIIELVKH